MALTCQSCFFCLLKHFMHHWEEERRRERKQKSSDNDIWEYRTEPPRDFDAPVPSSCLNYPEKKNMLKKLFTR